jgi:hypothetical protein
MHKHKTTEVGVCMCGGSEDTDNETLVVAVYSMTQQTEDCGKCYVKFHCIVVSQVSCDQSLVVPEFEALKLFSAVRNYRNV